MAAAADTTRRRAWYWTCGRSHTIRHASVFGAFEAIPVGGSLVLVAPHNPVPLLNQLAERSPISVEYLVEGPEEWRLRVNRLADEADQAGSR